METMELIAVMFSICFFNVASFMLGAMVGQKAQKGDPIKFEVKSPTKVYEEHKEQVEQKKEQERLQIISENIDNYDGTGLGQKDIPTI